MRTSAASWIFVGSFAACSLGASACELIVGGGDYKTGGEDGGSGSGTASSGTSSSGTSSSGTSSSGTSSSGTAASGTAASGTSSSGTGGSGTSSSGTASSGTSSSGASSGAGGDAGNNASAFVGTWQTSTTQTFSNCTDTSYNGSLPTKAGSFTWVASGSGLTGNGNGCAFSATVAGTIALLAPNSTCTITSASETDLFTFNKSVWELGTGGATATLFLTGTDTAMFSDGTSSTCDVSISGTATR